MSVEETTKTLELAGVSMKLQLDPMVWSPTGFAMNMADQLKAHIEPGMEVLELGLGSGVLAILAAKLQASKVVALDVNHHAIPNALLNWKKNNLPEDRADFRKSDLWSSLDDADRNRFSVIWSNPPVLPVLPEVSQIKNRKDDYEIAGPDGRTVLDAVISGSKPFLKPGGVVLTIATSLQGRAKTEELLEKNWRNWEVLKEVSLPLTEECTPEYIDWWNLQSQKDGENRIYKKANDWWHDIWYLKFWNPR